MLAEEQRTVSEKELKPSLSRVQERHQPTRNEKFTNPYLISAKTLISQSI